MAALGLHAGTIGHHIQRNCRFLRNNLEQLWGHRTFGSRQQIEGALKETAETIVIPRKKTWSKVAVLEALASTVSRDFTGHQYQFQDDPFLSPRSFPEARLFTLSQEAGRSAAKYFVNSHPKFFTTDFAMPHIPCLMPETVSPHLEEVSEEALKERISLRRVTAAVDMYDQLLQAGTAVSMETTHDLLDLICLYCDKDPNQDGVAEMENTQRKRNFQSTDVPTIAWKENNNAERIFNLLPERDTQCYSALIRGMVMHGAFARAFSFYTDMLNNRLTADVHIFNALISAAPYVEGIFAKKWNGVVELLNHMSEQKVQPNLLTFNSVLKALRSYGPLARTYCRQTLQEMKALGIAPSLASFYHILAIFKKTGRTGLTSILQEIMHELAGSHLTCQDPDDVLFFKDAMKVCLQNKDLELCYKIQSLVEVGENCRLLGNSHQQGYYYESFFSLVCLMEHIDVVLSYYRRFVPSVFYIKTQGLKDLMQALDTDNRLDLLPTIWKDIQFMSHETKVHVVEEFLTLMARDKHSPEVQESFGLCALDAKSLFDGSESRTTLKWRSSSLSNVATLLLRANKTQQAWDTLKLFKSQNRVPPEGLLEDFLTVCRSDGSAQRAVKLVQLSAAFSLSATPRLAKLILAEFDLTEEQRAVVSELESAEGPSV